MPFNLGLTGVLGNRRRSRIPAATGLVLTLEVNRSITGDYTDAVGATEYGVERVELDDDDSPIGAYEEIDRVLQGVGTFNDPFDAEGQYEFMRPRFAASYLPRNEAGVPLQFNPNTGNYDGKVVDTSVGEPDDDAIEYTAANTTELNAKILLCTDPDEDYVIKCTGGNVFTGDINVPNRGAGTGYLTITTDDVSAAAMDLVRPAGTRAQPDDIAFMPEWRPGSANRSIVILAAAAKRVRFRRIFWTNGPSIHTSSHLMHHGESAGGSPVANAVHHIYYDQCVSLTTARTDKITRFNFMDGFDIAHEYGYYFGFWANGSDSQALAATEGGARYRIYDCRLTAESESFASGGGAGSLGELQDLEMRKFYCKVPLSWFPAGAYGSDKALKNLFEMKEGTRFLIEDFVLENMVADAQPGNALVLWSVNQTGTHYTAETGYGVIRFGRVINAGGGISFADILDGTSYSEPMHDLHIHDLTFEKMRPVTAEANSYRTFTLGCAAADPVKAPGVVNLSIERVSGGCPLDHFRLENWQTSDRYAGLRLRDMALGAAANGIVNSFGSGAAALADFTPGDSEVSGIVSNTPAGSFPSGNLMDDPEFTDVTTGDLSLEPTSPALGYGQSGRDSGADVALVLSRTAGVIDDDYEY